LDRWNDEPFVRELDDQMKAAGLTA